MTSSSPVIIPSSSPTRPSSLLSPSALHSTPQLVFSPDGNDNGKPSVTPSSYHRPIAVTEICTPGTPTPNPSNDLSKHAQYWPRTPSPSRRLLGGHRPRPLYLNDSTRSSSSSPYSPRHRSPLHRSRSSSSPDHLVPLDGPGDRFGQSSSPYNTATPTTWPHTDRTDRYAAATPTSQRQTRRGATGAHTTSPRPVSWPRKRYNGNSLRTPAVIWPPPGFGNFLARRPAASPLYPQPPTRGTAVTGFTPGPELDVFRRSSVTSSYQDIQGRRQSVCSVSTSSAAPSLRYTHPAARDATNPPSLVGWNEPFVTVKQKSHENMHESNNTSGPTTLPSTSLGKRSASDFDLSEAPEPVSGAFRRESQIGPTDPIPQGISRNKFPDGFARPGPSPYQRDGSSARTRTFGWAENVRNQTSGTANDADRSGSTGEEARVSLPGIKELFTMAGDVEAGRAIPGRHDSASARWRSDRRTSSSTDITNSSYQRGSRLDSGGFTSSPAGSLGTAPSLFSSTYRDSVGSLIIATPSRGSHEFSFSYERDNSLSSDSRKSSWNTNLPYALERRTMGLGLEDPNGNNALASLREDASDGEALDDPSMDVEPSGVRLHRNSPERTTISRAASGTSALGIKGLLGSSEEWNSEDHSRPYTTPNTSSNSLSGPEYGVSRADVQRSSKRRKGSPSGCESLAQHRRELDQPGRLPLTRAPFYGRSESTPHLHLNIREFGGISRPTLPPLGSMTSFSSIRSTVETPSESGASRYSQGLFGQPTRFHLDAATPSTSTVNTPVITHPPLREPSQAPSSISGGDTASRNSSPLRTIEASRSGSNGYFGRPLPGIDSFASPSRNSSPGTYEQSNVEPLFPHFGRPGQQQTLPLPDPNGRRASLTVTDLEATATLGIPHGVVLTQSADEVSLDKSGNPGVGPRYGCDFCGKTFSRPSSLKIHIYTHTGEKPYVCNWPHCHRQFSVQSNLKRHAKVHYEAAAALTASKQVTERHRGLPRMERHHSDIARS